MVEYRADRIRIDAPHQFADVLLLSPECPALVHALGIENRVEQGLIQIHRPQLRFEEGNEFLPELLPRQVFALPGAFTGLCIVHRLKYLTPDPGPGVYHGNCCQTRIAGTS